MSPARRSPGASGPSPQAYVFLVVAILAVVGIFLGRDACGSKLGQLFGVATGAGPDAGTSRAKARDASLRPPDAGRPGDDW